MLPASAAGAVASAVEKPASPPKGEILHKRLRSWLPELLGSASSFFFSAPPLPPRFLLLCSGAGADEPDLCLAALAFLPLCSSPSPSPPSPPPPPYHSPRPPRPAPPPPPPPLVPLLLPLRSRRVTSMPPLCSSAPTPPSPSSSLSAPKQAADPLHAAMAAFYSKCKPPHLTLSASIPDGEPAFLIECGSGRDEGRRETEG